MAIEGARHGCTEKVMFPGREINKVPKMGTICLTLIEFRGRLNINENYFTEDIK